MHRRGGGCSRWIAHGNCLGGDGRRRRVRRSGVRRSGQWAAVHYRLYRLPLQRRLNRLPLESRPLHLLEPSDRVRVVGHPVQARRARAGVVEIREVHSVLPTMRMPTALLEVMHGMLTGGLGPAGPSTNTSR